MGYPTGPNRLGLVQTIVIAVGFGETRVGLDRKIRPDPTSDLQQAASPPWGEVVLLEERANRRSRRIVKPTDLMALVD